MTITTEHCSAAQRAVGQALSGAHRDTILAVAAWVKANTGFNSLADMVTSAIAHGYSPTIRPTHQTVKAYRDADRVANAFDAAMSWAFTPDTGPRAYRPDTVTFTHRPR